MRLPRLSDARKIIEWANEVAKVYERDFEELRGSRGQITLTASATTTTLTAGSLRPTRKVILTPTTSNAAAALATTYVSSIAKGTATITHANNAQTDRTFDYVVS